MSLAYSLQIMFFLPLLRDHLAFKTSLTGVFFRGIPLLYICKIFTCRPVSAICISDAVNQGVVSAILPAQFMTWSKYIRDVFTKVIAGVRQHAQIVLPIWVSCYLSNLTGTMMNGYLTRLWPWSQGQRWTWGHLIILVIFIIDCDVLDLLTHDGLVLPFCIINLHNHWFM